MIAVFLPFILKFLGEGAIQSWLNAKVTMANSAAEVDKTYINAQVTAMQFELKRWEAQRDLQIAGLPYASMRWPKSFLMWCASIYWGCRLLAEGLNVASFKVVISDLSPAAAGVSATILGYMFLSGDVQKIMRK